MDPNTLSVIQGAAGAGGGDKVYVEDVFSTDLWLGNATSRSITNGIDLDGEGGLVWIKARDNDYHHALFDTETGANERLRSDDLVEATTVTQYLTAFNSDGFTIGTDDDVNENNDDYVSWSFRKAPGFFDVVEYTGNGTSNGDTKTISHNLGSTPGFVIIRRTSDSGGYWLCWHRSLNGTGTPDYDNRRYIELNRGTSYGSMGGDIWGTIDASEFQVKYNDTTGQDAYEINENGATYIAYFFAHDDQQFGDGGDEAIIKCGSFNAGYHTESLGFEPQWLLVKRPDMQDWKLVDNMRGFKDKTQDSKQLKPNEDEDENTGPFHLTSDGFYYSSSTVEYLYVAIRRGPMKTPTDATEVFSADHLTNGSTPGIKAGFPVDLGIFKALTGSSSWLVYDRLRWENALYTDKDDDEDASSNFIGDNMIGFYDYSTADSDYIGYSFRRAPGFFDIVAYTGDGTSDGSYSVNHNLEVIPEMIIAKDRDSDNYWNTYHSGLTSDTYLININLNDAQTSIGQSWEPAAASFTPLYAGSSYFSSNHSGQNYIAYLFATCPGVSKVGSETADGSAIEVNCGFTAGARFVMIKRTDAAGDWYVYDSLRGIASGNDDFLLINEPDDEDSNDYIDPFTTGFEITSSLPSGDYIYLAIA